MNHQNGDPQERFYPDRMEWEGELRYKFYNHSYEHPFTASTIRNIGHKGVCFISSMAIPVGSVLILKLYQHKDYAPIKVLAKVYRCDPAPEHEGYAIDCDYHDLTSAEQMLIEEVVEEVRFIRRIRSTLLHSLNHQAPSTPPQQELPHSRKKKRFKRAHHNI